MNILFIAKHKRPRIGGVERHLESISKSLSLRGYKITTISEEDIKPPKIKYFGLLYIWYWLFKNRKLITLIAGGKCKNNKTFTIRKYDF